MYCKYCGKQLSDDSKFCSNCGSQVTFEENGQNSFNYNQQSYQQQQYQSQQQYQQQNQTFHSASAVCLPDRLRSGSESRTGK